MTKKRLFARLSASAAAVTLAASATLGAGAAPAQAQSSAPYLPDLPSMSSDPGKMFDDFNNQTRENAWNKRNEWRAQADAGLDPNLARGVKDAIDVVVNTLFPGLIAEKQAEQARQVAEAQAKAQAAQARPNPGVDFSACPAQAKACVDVEHQKSWLQENGHVTYGPVDISTGAEGADTTAGWHQVNRKVRDEVSHEFNNAPMPYAVYFTYNGIAFHEGSPALYSNGCVHLNHDDAVHYFDNLNEGDQVFVWGNVHGGVPGGASR